MRLYGPVLLKPTLVLAVCMSLISGCATRDSGYRITSETTAFVQPGVTTRADLIENLGQPLLEIKDPHVLAYSWGKVRPKAGVRNGQDQSMLPGGQVGAGTYIASPPTLEEYGSVEAARWVYCVALDDKDRVTRMQTVKLENQPSVEQAVRRWAGTAATP